MYPRKRNNRADSGLSLLEVVLALAILGVSAAFLTQAMQLATQNALKAQNLSQAEVVAESVVSQIVAGVLPAQPITWSPYGVSMSSTSWLYAITMVPAEVQGMMGIQVAVRDSGRVSTSDQPDLLVTRWIIDPSLGLDTPPELETSGESTSSGDSSGTQDTAGGAQGSTAAQTGGMIGGAMGGAGGFGGAGNVGQQGRGGQGRGGTGADGGRGGGPGNAGQRGQGGGGQRGPGGSGGPGGQRGPSTGGQRGPGGGRQGGAGGGQRGFGGGAGGARGGAPTGGAGGRAGGGGR